MEQLPPTTQPDCMRQCLRKEACEAVKMAFGSPVTDCLLLTTSYDDDPDDIDDNSDVYTMHLSSG